MNLSEIAKKLLQEEQKHIRMMVVEGRFPLPPNDLIYVIGHYAIENKENIREECIKALKSFPTHIIKNFINQPDLEERFLYFFSYLFQDNIELLRAILLHPKVPIKVFKIFSKVPNDKILEILLQNEEKWQSDQEVIENLLNNRALPREFYQKVLQYKGEDRNEVKNEGEIQSVEKFEFKKDVVFEKKEDFAKEKELFIHEIDENDVEKKRSIAGKISKMGVAEKIKLATLGNKEVRAILIKDTNKLVCTAVLKNPRITEGEIVKFSQDKNLPDEIIRIIANDRNWTQNYNVRFNLVMNPKTPLQNAIKFLSTLSVKDLGTVAKSKNISAQLSTLARKILATRKG